MGSIWKVVLSFAVIIMITAVGITVTAANADVAAAGTYLEARVRLQYPYRLPVFGIQVYKVKERIL